MLVVLNYVLYVVCVFSLFAFLWPVVLGLLFCLDCCVSFVRKRERVQENKNDQKIAITGRGGRGYQGEM